MFDMPDAIINDTLLLKLFKALADENRMHMVREIARAGELTCSQVVERSPIGQATVSHHLKILMESGLLHDRREGQFCHLSVNRELFERFQGSLDDVLMPCLAEIDPDQKGKQ